MLPPSSSVPPFDLRFLFLDPPMALLETRDMVSTLGDREYCGVWLDLSKGGKEVCRRGCDDAEVVDSIEALRRLTEGADDGISDCLRFGGCGREVEDG